MHGYAWKLHIFGSCRLARKKSVSYIIFHSRDRMTWDENTPYYLGDLHLLNIAFFVRSILKVEFGELDLPPFLFLAIGFPPFLLLAIGPGGITIAYWLHTGAH